MQHTFKSHRGPVLSLAVSPNDKTLSFGSVLPQEQAVDGILRFVRSTGIRARGRTPPNATASGGLNADQDAAVVRARLR